MFGIISSRTPAFAYPAGQALGSNPAQNIANAIANTAAQLTGSNYNSLGQMIDANGKIVLDSNGNPVMKPAIPAPVVVQSTQPYDFGGLIVNVLISAVVVGGAAYVGSFFGSERAARRMRSRAA